MSKKKVDEAWEEADHYMKEVEGAWESCEAAYKPVNGAWEKIWSAEPYITLAWAYETWTGGNPQYIYEPSDDGMSAHYKLYTPDNANAEYRSDLMLRVPHNANAGDTLDILFTLSDSDGTYDYVAAGSYTQCAVSYTNSQGSIINVDNTNGITDGTYKIQMTLCENCEYIGICFQIYGYKGYYITGIISDLTINGESIKFK